MQRFVSPKFRGKPPWVDLEIGIISNTRKRINYISYGDVCFTKFKGKPP